MKIAVTAASGRLGHATLRALVAEAGAGDVVGVARSPARIGVPAIEKRAGDYESVDSMVAALRGIDTMVMISAPVKPGLDRLAAHRNAIEAARRAGVATVVYSSIIGRDIGPERLFYPAHHANRETERLLRESGLGWIVNRNGLYMELDVEHIIRANAGDRVYRNPAGSGRAPYITIDELACGMARLAMGRAEHGRAYNLTGACATQAELVALADEVFGLEVRYETESDAACIDKFRRLMPERGEATALMLTGCFQCMRYGDFDVTSDYEAATGRQPKSLRRMMADCRARRAARG